MPDLRGRPAFSQYEAPRRLSALPPAELGGGSEGPMLDRAAEAGEGMALRCHEHMLP
jgi:hypothetical protein